MDTNDILKERCERYGDFNMQSKISQDLKFICHEYSEAFMPYQIEALDMIINKIARILNGDPDYIDSWQDIAGYAQLVVNILEKQKGTTHE